jgi:hypothetical protein
MNRSPFNHKAVAWAGALAIALGAVIMLGPTAQAGTLRRASTSSSASGGADPGTFLTAYFDVAPGSEAFGAGDNALRIENPTAANGDLCAMIYIFDASEEMGCCAGCPLTPNQLLQDSVETIIGSSWEIAGGTPAQGVIQIVSALPNSGSPVGGATAALEEIEDPCNPAVAYTPTANLNGWITHAQVIPVSPGSPTAIPGITEVSLTDNGAADATEAAFLISECGDILSNGSGKGVCNCPTQPDGTVPPPA